MIHPAELKAKVINIIVIFNARNWHFWKFSTVDAMFADVDIDVGTF